MKAVIFTHVLYLILIKAFMVKGVTKCESKVELRAVLLSCPTKDSGCDDDDPLSQAMKAEEAQILQADSKNFESLREEKERGFPNAVKDCKRKLVITLKVKNVGKIPCDDEFIVVDHVFDPVTGGRGRLLSPVVVKLRQEQMIQLYGLEFQRVVNSDPFEEQKAGAKRCSVDPENPTCGIAMYDGKPIPFSEGFCCSCDPHMNEKRQLSPVSRGDSLLYRDSKLISQGNTRFLRQEKASAIVNPELVQLKAPPEEATQARNKKTPLRGGISDALCWDKIPNFLLEHDRKIVCDRGDFMNELCKLHQRKIEVEGKPSENYKSEGAAGGAGEENKALPPSKADSLNEDNVNNVVALNNFIKALNGDRTTSSVPLPEGYGPAKGSRGKRENRGENKKLTLEEKLDRFVSSRKSLTNRRKRLLELSHRRFRKIEERCREDPQSQNIAVKGCAPGGYPRQPPPRYFFSHDRAIIDPLENVDMTVNSTCKSPKDMEYEEASKNQAYRLSAKNELFKSFDTAKQQEKMGDRAFYHRQPNGEDKLMRKDKFFVGKMSNKKEKVSHMEEGRMEPGGGKEDSLKGTASPRGDARFNPYKGVGEKEETDENAENKEGKAVKEEERENEKRSRYNAENFLHKGEFEKKVVRPRIRNFFMAKNREKQKLRSELMKSHKKSELRHKEAFEAEKRRERLKVDSEKGSDVEFSGRKSEEKEKGKGELKGSEELGNAGLLLQPTTEKTQVSLHQFPMSKGMTQEKEGMKGERKYMKPPLQRKPQESRFHAPKKAEGNINFNVEIIRNHVPGITKHRHHSTAAEKFVRNRVDASSMALKTNVHNLNPKTLYLKSKQSLHYTPSQGYYLLDNDRSLPQDAFVMKNRPRVDATSKTRGQPGYLYKKPSRRYYLPVGEDAASTGRPRQALHETQRRGKRHSEPGEGSRGSRPKRSTPDSLYGSEMDARQPKAIHPPEPCLAEKKARKRAPDGRTGKLASLHVGRSNHENSSADSSLFSSLQELQSRGHHPTAPSREPSKRERNAKPSSDRQRLIKSYLNAPDYVLEEVESALKGKRQTGEQVKTEAVREPPSCEKDAYCNECAQDTAHCMRFGDLWYGLYTIKKPVIAQLVGIQLFDKHSLCDGTSQWRDLTKGRAIRIGTFFTKAEDELPTMSLTFMGEKTKKVESAIDPDNYFLLIPSHVSDPSKVNSYPQFEGGPAEYLLVQSKDISSGGECNMIGTSFEAFARQPDRCAQRRGSCLKRQPVDLWREDMEARIRGKRGKYFVENFGNLPNSPVKTYTNLTGEFLALEYYGEYTSTIEIEVKADSNAIIRKGSNAQIPLVYIDSTYPKKTRIILSVLNIGLTSSYFRPRLGDCPPDLDPAWCPLEGPLVTIPPQQRHDFKLDLSGTLPGGQIFLAVQVLNQVNKQIAFRRIVIKKGDRCVCAFHCKCNCIGNLIGGRTCRRLSVEEYRKAGYIGPYPFRGGAAASAPESILGNLHIVLLTASYLLLFLGILKGLLGVFIRRIGIAGTRIIMGPRVLCEYYECELKGCSVLYDEFGFPVHPTTCQPVQIVPLWLELIVNLFFFFLYPLRGIWFLILSLPCCAALCSDFESCCQNDEGEGDNKSSRPLLASLDKGPAPTCVHYNLTTIDSKKSKLEYLPYPAYKGDDDPLEEDDTEFVLQEMKRYRKK